MSRGKLLERKIVIVTSAQPVANPRAVKEAKALQQQGYNVTVIYAPLSPWGDEFDKKLFAETPNIHWISAGYHQYKQSLKYKYARVRRKIFEKLFKLGLENYAADYASILFCQELTNAAKRCPADLYIAHNLGALPAAIKAAKKYKANTAFDAEDFHRGENVLGSFHWRHTVYLENKYLPQLSYLSTASPLITKEYKQLFSQLSVFTINNVFPLNFLQPLAFSKSQNTLKLFWFSQTIGPKRGLEDVIKAMGILNNEKIKLHLLGNLSLSSKQYFEQLVEESNIKKEQIEYLLPVEEDKIAEIASTCDIGLALEVPYYLNREICLTNKIFIYLLAGNAIVFSNTKSQEKFLKENIGIGKIYSSGSPEELALIFQFYLNNPDVLLEHRKNSWSLAKDKFNWDNEKLLLKNKIEKILGN